MLGLKLIRINKMGPMCNVMISHLNFPVVLVGWTVLPSMPVRRMLRTSSTHRVWMTACTSCVTSLASLDSTQASRTLITRESTHWGLTIIWIFENIIGIWKLCLQNVSHYRWYFANIFKCLFLNKSDFILIQISLKFVSEGQIDKWVSIGSGEGLAPNRRQAIIWTNDDHD